MNGADEFWATAQEPGDHFRVNLVSAGTLRRKS
jgi:hypothetical protein